MRKWDETRDDVKDGGRVMQTKTLSKQTIRLMPGALICCPARENSQTTQLGNGYDTVL